MTEESTYDTFNEMRFFRTRMFKIEISKRKALQKILKTNLGLNSNETKQTIDNINEKIMSYAIHRFTNNCLLFQVCMTNWCLQRHRFIHAIVNLINFFYL